jgi:hypothetical protein
MIPDNSMLLPSNLEEDLLDTLICVYINAWMGQTKAGLNQLSDELLFCARTYATIKVFEILGDLETNNFKWKRIPS